MKDHADADALELLERRETTTYWSLVNRSLLALGERKMRARQGNLAATAQVMRIRNRIVDDLQKELSSPDKCAVHVRTEATDQTKKDQRLVIELDLSQNEQTVIASDIQTALEMCARSLHNRLSRPGHSNRQQIMTALWLDVLLVPHVNGVSPHFIPQCCSLPVDSFIHATLRASASLLSRRPVPSHTTASSPARYATITPTEPIKLLQELMNLLGRHMCRLRAMSQLDALPEATEIQRTGLQAWQAEWQDNIVKDVDELSRHLEEILLWAEGLTAETQRTGHLRDSIIAIGGRLSCLLAETWEPETIHISPEVCAGSYEALSVAIAEIADTCYRWFIDARQHYTN